jgi:hypothetical protein
MFKKHKASILGATLVILGIILVSALSFSLVSIQERKASLGENQSAQSLDTANSASEIILKEIYSGNYDSKTLEEMAMVLHYAYNSGTSTMSGTLSSGKTFSIQFLDKDGNPIKLNDPDWRQNISDLKTAGISASASRAVKVKVKGVLSCDDNADVMLVIDTSPTIDAAEMTKIKQAATSVVNTLFSGKGTGTIRIGQVSFNFKPHLDISLTAKTKKADILKAINNLPSEGSGGAGSTDTADAVMLANDAFNHTDSVDDIIILITDGQPHICVKSTDANYPRYHKKTGCGANDACGYFGSPTHQHTVCPVTEDKDKNSFEYDSLAFSEAKQAADLVKGQKYSSIYSVAVGIDSDYARDLLKYMSSGERYYFEADNFNKLEETLKEFIQCEK